MNPESEFIARCRSNGIRQPSKERLSVIRCVYEFDDSFSADELVKSVLSKEFRITRVMVFRTLATLVTVGMLSTQAEEEDIYHFIEQ